MRCLHIAVRMEKGQLPYLCADQEGTQREAQRQAGFGILEELNLRQEAIFAREVPMT